MMSSAADQDRSDKLAHLREAFDLPESLIYLDGNSLGALPKSVKATVLDTVETEWGRDLIKSWNSHDWINLPETVGEKIAPLIGADTGQVICTDSTSINLYKLILAALHVNSDRKKILSQIDNFPTDLYMAQGAADLLGPERAELVAVPADVLLNHIDDQTALVMLTHVNFRDGRIHDMEKVTRAAHEQGALVLWDLSHSAGAMPLALDELHVDFATGCGYKYLNGGPGAPAYVYVNRRLHAKVWQPLYGWMGHADAFSFSPDYRPAEGVWRFVTGTPGVISMKALSSALDLFADVDLADIRKKSEALTEFFVASVASCTELEMISPISSGERGSQVSLRHHHGYAIIQALAADGVIGDYRDPGILRFGFSPLYTSFNDVKTAADKLLAILDKRTYMAPEFQIRRAVT